MPGRSRAPGQPLSVTRHAPASSAAGSRGEASGSLFGLNFISSWWPGKTWANFLLFPAQNTDGR